MKPPPFSLVGEPSAGLEGLKEDGLVAHQLVTVHAQPPDDEMLLPAVPVQQHALCYSCGCASLLLHALGQEGTKRAGCVPGPWEFTWGLVSIGRGAHGVGSVHRAQGGNGARRMREWACRGLGSASRSCASPPCSDLHQVGKQSQLYVES